ncbi:hypothetical protein LOC67_23455 [Stieleria sp. JC731]|uniref:hypothetical protein n=1 Tax=Pirellulaceae TaxID=2691357 RepID=UPI001E56FF42|nr:hypothetical protein [Stieleria sp. JC731]MCC9603517.1 hypothetical protein [Stieleria sp. JC731]
MTKASDDSVRDAALELIQDNVTKVVLLSAAVTIGTGGYSDANTELGTGSGKKLGEVTVDSSDFTLGDDDTDGRKLTLSAQAVGILQDGDATHAAWLDVANTKVLHLLDLGATATVATSEVTRTLNAHSLSIRDTTAVS